VQEDRSLLFQYSPILRNVRQLTGLSPPAVTVAGFETRQVGGLVQPQNPAVVNLLRVWLTLAVRGGHTPRGRGAYAYGLRVLLV
jgi:hypothetical protein